MAIGYDRAFDLDPGDEESESGDEEILFDRTGLLNGQVARRRVRRMRSVRDPVEHIPWSSKFSRLVRTFALCSAFFVLGLCISVPGPTLLDLQKQVDASVTQITSIFTARSSGYLIGSLFGGVLFDKYDQRLLLFTSLTWTAIAVAATPWCKAFGALMTAMALMGAGMGFLDTGGNVMCLELWGDQSGPYMQALHFSFGLGAFVAPLLAEPFLAQPILSEGNDSQPTFQALVVPSSFDQLKGEEDVKLRARRSEPLIGLLIDLGGTQNDSMVGLNIDGESKSNFSVKDTSLGLAGETPPEGQPDVAGKLSGDGMLKSDSDFMVTNPILEGELPHNSNIENEPEIPGDNPSPVKYVGESQDEQNNGNSSLSEISAIDGEGVAAVADGAAVAKSEEVTDQLAKPSSIVLDGKNSSAEYGGKSSSVSVPNGDEVEALHKQELPLNQVVINETNINPEIVDASQNVANITETETLVKSDVNLGNSTNLNSGNNTLVKSDESLGNSTDLNSGNNTFVTMTVIPGTEAPVTKRVPRLKPSVNDGKNLDNSVNWDKIKLPNPTPEAVPPVVLEVTNKTTGSTNTTATEGSVDGNEAKTLDPLLPVVENATVGKPAITTDNATTTIVPQLDIANNKIPEVLNGSNAEVVSNINNENDTVLATPLTTQSSGEGLESTMSPVPTTSEAVFDTSAGNAPSISGPSVKDNSNKSQNESATIVVIPEPDKTLEESGRNESALEDNSNKSQNENSAPIVPIIPEPGEEASRTESAVVAEVPEPVTAKEEIGKSESGVVTKLPILLEPVTVENFSSGEDSSNSMELVIPSETVKNLEDSDEIAEIPKSEKEILAAVDSEMGGSSEESNSSEESRHKIVGRPRVKEESQSSNKQTTVSISDNVNIQNNSTTTNDVSTVPSRQKVHYAKPENTFSSSGDDQQYPLDGIAKKIEEYGVTKIHIVYTIIAVLIFHVALMFLCFVCAKPGREHRPLEAQQKPVQVGGKVFMFILVGLLSLFFFLYVGMEVAYGQLVMTFSVHSDLNLSKSKGSFITAMFWGSFAAMRFVSIFLARVLKPTKMIILDFVLVSCGCIALSVGAATSEPVLWIGSAFVGAGMASVFPTGFLWAEQHITVTNKIASFFVVGAAAGEMVCPLVVGLVMETLPMALMHQLTAANVLCILTFGAAWWLVNRRKGQGQGPSAQYHIADQNDEDEIVDFPQLTSRLRASA